MRVTVSLAGLAVALVLGPQLALADLPDSRVDLHRDSYLPGQSVEFRLANDGLTPIVVLSTAPWKILDDRGKVVFYAVGLIDGCRTLLPGESYGGDNQEWFRWNQRDNSGRTAAAGTYTAVVWFVDRATCPTPPLPPVSEHAERTATFRLLPDQF